jgi:hypothetical protein
MTHATINPNARMLMHLRAEHIVITYEPLAHPSCWASAVSQRAVLPNNGWGLSAP